MSTQVKEHPIIFSSESIKAILNGSKTQSRRVIKPQPYEYAGRWVWAFRKGKLATGGYWLDHCPYGQVGDRLWVRELFRIRNIALDSVWYSLEYEAGGVAQIEKLSDEGFRAGWIWEKHHDKKRPPIFMPRWASRITLEITEVRVERLQEITEGDCYKEGITDFREILPMIAKVHQPIHSFKHLWDSLNAKRGYGWEVNPWVFIISFKRKQKDE